MPPSGPMFKREAVLVMRGWRHWREGTGVERVAVLPSSSVRFSLDTQKKNKRTRLR